MEKLKRMGQENWSSNNWSWNEISFLLGVVKSGALLRARMAINSGDQIPPHGAVRKSKRTNLARAQRARITLCINVHFFKKSVTQRKVPVCLWKWTFSFQMCKGNRPAVTPNLLDVYRGFKWHPVSSNYSTAVSAALKSGAFFTTQAMFLSKRLSQTCK